MSTALDALRQGLDHLLLPADNGTYEVHGQKHGVLDIRELPEQ